MQLKLNSCSFTEQVEVDIAWSHFARAWVKYGQTEKKISTLRIFISTVWFLEAFHGGFPINIYQPSHWSPWKVPEREMQSCTWRFLAHALLSYKILYITAWHLLHWGACCLLQKLWEYFFLPAIYFRVLSTIFCHCFFFFFFCSHGLLSVYSTADSCTTSKK